MNNQSHRLFELIRRPVSKRTWPRLEGADLVDDLLRRSCPINFAIGFLISSVCLWLVKSPEQVTFLVYLRRLVKAIRFLFFFIYEVLAANVRVAWEVLTPKHHMRPAIIAIPLDDLSDF